MTPYYLSLAAAVLFGIVGQLALKSGANEAPTMVAQFLSPLTIVGLAIYLLAALCYIAALKKLPITLAFPSVSASYAVVAVLAHFMWQEPLGWPQVGGIALIGGGILMLHLQ